MLQEKYLPAFHFRSRHAIVIQASPGKIFTSLEEVDFRSSWIIRFLFFLRGIPAMGLQDLSKLDFVRLETIPDQEVIVGLIGRFWKLNGDLQHFEAKDFRGFNRPGFARATWNFQAEIIEGGSTRLITETRISVPGERARRNFARYWFFIRPFSGVIRMEILRAVKKRAELSLGK